MLKLMSLLAMMTLALGLQCASANPARYAADWSETDFSKHAVPLDEILSGGPPKDGIPSIDDPQFLVASEVEEIADEEPVIRLEINGDVRAYPLRVLTWHEIVNDTVGGRPVAVTYCPLCNSAIVFDRAVKGMPTTFGTTGMLRNSDLVMYDRATQSWWQQFTGEAIVGERTGTALDMVPSRVVAFAAFRDEAPEGRVLVPPAGSIRAYGRNPYVSYDSRQAPYPFYRGSMPEGIGPMVRVVAIKEGGEPVAVSLPLLAEKGEVRVGDVTLSYEPGVASALDAARIAEGRDVGAVRVTRGGRDVVHDVTFAFAFHAFHPDARIVTR